MFCKYPKIIVIVLSFFCAHVVNTSPGIPWIEIGVRQENDQFIFVDCAVSDLTEFGNETTLLFEYSNVNRTHVRVDVDPGWHQISFYSWDSSNRLDLTVMNRNTTQLAVRINVFGYPNTDTEADVKSSGDNQLSTRRVIDSDDYEGNSVRIV
ncbi:hypothetical protein HA402_011046 [Bradysia odoriphaga]|nr:hypothetical protein HA402_011046 [Bradysia odoriphaga]